MAEIRTRVAAPEYRKGRDAVFGKKWRDPVKKYDDYFRKLTGKDIEARSKLLFGDWECGVTGREHPDDGRLASAVKHVRLATRSTSR